MRIEIVNLRYWDGPLPRWMLRVDRRTRWGNPWTITEANRKRGWWASRWCLGILFSTRRAAHRFAVRRYRSWWRKQTSAQKLLLKIVRERDITHLACWCYTSGQREGNLPCHAQVLAEWLCKQERGKGKR